MASSSVHDEDQEEIFADDPADHAGCSIPATICCLLTCPITVLSSFFVVNVNEEVVVLNCGKYTDLYKEPGCYFKNCIGRELRRVSKQKTSINLPNVKILDLNGNPLHVSGIVVYSFERTKRVAIDMQNAHQYVENQSLAVLKQIVSRYPYEHWEEGDHEDCLKTSGDKISNELVRTLQKQVSIAGAKVHTFQLNEISYAPEIAQGMLKRQQAEALVSARKTIVEGAIEISTGAVRELEKRGVKMQPEEKSKIVSNLLTVICAEGHVQPTLNLGAN